MAMYVVAIVIIFLLVRPDHSEHGQESWTVFAAFSSLGIYVLYNIKLVIVRYIVGKKAYVPPYDE